MDDLTKSLVDEFVTYLTKQIQQRKMFHPVQLGKWSLKDFKVTLHCFINNIPDEVYVDVREIKENQNHFLHLTNNVLDQLQAKMGNKAT